MITRFEVTGNLRAKVFQEFQEDPTMGTYAHVVEVVREPPMVRVGAPLAAQKPLTNLEITSVAQLLLGAQASVATQASDEIEAYDHVNIFRRWRTYPLDT